MLRCRKCRKGVIELTCLSMTTDQRSAAVCSIWHVNVDKLPEWILNSVLQAQWTTGRLNCYNCGARLGGFNFINHSECPCGQDATVHLIKSRVDYDHKHSFLIIQPKRTRPRKGQCGVLTDGPRCKEERPEVSGTTLESLQLSCAAVMSHVSPAGSSEPLTESKNTQRFSFSPLNCISCRRRCNLEADGDFTQCSFPAAPSDISVVDVLASRSSASHPAGHQSDTDGQLAFNILQYRSDVSGGTLSPLHQQLPQSLEVVESFVNSTSVHTEVSASVLLAERRSPSDRAADLEVDVTPQLSLGSLFLIRQRKREKNRLKNQRRKERRRERWLNGHLEEEPDEGVTGSPLDSEEEDRDGLTCAVCLDIYFSPYSCQPCGHVFCEPCLRTLTKNHPTKTPCPMCRTFISHTSFHKELNQMAKTFFPKVYITRKQNFHGSSCAKWPLPSFRRSLPSFCGYLRNAAMPGRRRHFAHGGLTLVALNLNGMCDWLFDALVYMHVMNWVLVFLFTCILLYYFF
ncbi:E3 ubiquitin-protein ligase RNF180 [Xenentodon cancila]